MWMHGCSVAKSCPTLCNSTDYNTAGFPALHCLSEFALTPLSWWCHPTISSSVASFCSQSSPASRSFPINQLFTSGGQSTRASASVLPVNIVLIPFRIDWFDLLAVQGTLTSLLQHHSSKASILQHSAFFMVQLPHLYMTTGKTIALTKQNFVGKVMSLLS